MTMSPKDMAEAAYEYLKGLPRPKPVKCSDEIRQWFETTALPVLKDQVLSELRRKDGCPPRLVAFRDTGGVAVVDVEQACGGNWGNEESKDRTAYVHLIGAMVPTVKASVFCVEMWFLRGPNDHDFRKSLRDHPDRREAVMFQMIHHVQPDNTIMQLTATVEVIKVLGHNTSPEAWADTKYGEATISDPMGDDEYRMEGRFVHE